MKKTLLLLCSFSVLSVFGQDVTVVLNPDMKVNTQHQVTINGNRINYTVETGTQPVWDASGKPIAFLHYNYYTRNEVKDRADRPLLISFNGGPGSASVWMHLAYTGPRILKIDDEGYP
ncbi:MAG: carboxypeptidase, partial [Flavobacterium sp.]